jgi:N-acetylglucosamine-6-phosphate deacetylase
MKAIINGQIYYEGKFQKGKVLIYSNTIESILTQSAYEEIKKHMDEETNAEGNFVVPGFIDVHIHGYQGVDVMNGTTEALNTMKKGLVENGVTSFLATTMTMPKADITKALDAVREVMKEQEKTSYGATIVGVHLEGPFINAEKKGAQPEEYIIHPEEELVEPYLDLIKVITIAPEVEDSLAFIKKYHKSINFSLGHTSATYEEAMKAFECGACGSTHTFNAMTGMHHRKPGVVTAALTSDCYTELIADKFHVHEGLFPLFIKAKGLQKILLVTDCMQAGGLTEGEYELGGQKVTVSDGKCLLDSGTIAGSVLKLNEGLKNFHENVKEGLEQVLPIVTMNQAKYLGLDHQIGSLEEDKQADIVIMNDQFEIIKTIVKGNIEYENC